MDCLCTTVVYNHKLYFFSSKVPCVQDTRQVSQTFQNTDFFFSRQHELFFQSITVQSRIHCFIAQPFALACRPTWHLR